MNRCPKCSNELIIVEQSQPLKETKVKCSNCGFKDVLKKAKDHLQAGACGVIASHDNTNPSTHQSIYLNLLNTIQWNQYDDIEISPIAAYDAHDEILPWDKIDLAEHIDQVDFVEGNTGFSVYIHVIDGGLQCLADFQFLNEAELFGQFIEKNFIKKPVIHTNYMLSCTLSEEVDKKDFIQNITSAINNSDNCQNMIDNFDVYHIETHKIHK